MSAPSIDCASSVEPLPLRHMHKHHGAWLNRRLPLTDGGRETLPFLQFDFCHLDYEDDLQSLRNSNIT